MFTKPEIEAAMLLIQLSGDSNVDFQNHDFSSSLCEALTMTNTKKKEVVCDDDVDESQGSCTTSVMTSMTKSVRPYFLDEDEVVGRKRKRKRFRSIVEIYSTMDNLGLKSHVEEEASSSTTNPEWCKLDDLIKMAINLDNELRSIKIEKMTINEYCTKIESMADRLNNLGCVRVHPIIANQLDQIPPSQDHVAYYAQQAQQSHLAYPVQLQDNDCTIKFDAFGFSVKEFLTRHILFRCDSSDDLYPVTKPSTIPTAFVFTSFSTWHQHLASSQALLQQLIDSLHSEFDMTDLEALNYFLGIFVDRHPTRLFLSQGKYDLHLFERAHMVNCNPSRTPVNMESNLGSESVPVQDPTLYHNLAGGL
nr:ribonuclease H-like domain-containing protein [Tanacetum cinerariifolium]